MPIQYIINVIPGGNRMGMKTLLIPSGPVLTNSEAPAVSHATKIKTSLVDDHFDIFDLKTYGTVGKSGYDDIYCNEPMLSSSPGESSTLSPVSVNRDEECSSPATTLFGNSPNEPDDFFAVEQIPDDFFSTPDEVIIPADLSNFILDEQAVLTDADIMNVSDSILDGDLFSGEDLIFGDMLMETAAPSPPESSAAYTTTATPPFSPDSEVTDYGVSPSSYRREDSVEAPESTDDFDIFGDICPESYMNFGDATTEEDTSLFDYDMDQAPSPAGPAKRRSRGQGRPLTDAERKERKKESNRNAAFRYRQKMKAKAAHGESELSTAVSELQSIAAAVKESRQTLDLMIKLASEVAVERKRKRLHT